jgi:hypothetical protein
MAFSTNVQNITVDGRAVLTINGTSVGLISDAIAKATGIKRETTKGSPSVGYDLMIGASMVQTAMGDWGAAVDAVLAGSSTVALSGARNTVTVTDVYLSADLDMKFNNKSESKITLEAISPGVSAAAAKAWISTS